MVTTRSQSKKNQPVMEKKNVVQMLHVAAIKPKIVNKKKPLVDYESSEYELSSLSESITDTECSKVSSEKDDWIYEDDGLYKLFVEMNSKPDESWINSKFHAALIREYLYDACTFNDHQSVDPKEWIKYISFHVEQCPENDIAEFYNIIDRNGEDNNPCRTSYFGYCAVCNHNRTISKDMYVNGDYYSCGRHCCAKLQRVLDFYIYMKRITKSHILLKKDLQDSFEKIIEDLEMMVPDDF
jgi:hypothetical protein